MKLQLIVGYDGTGFNGWQIQMAQHGSRTVQYELEHGLRELTGEKIRVIAAGRTDAGVHARGQVIHFVTDSKIPVERWPEAINSVLPGDIRAYSAREVADEFHARFSARSKTYVYRIDNRRVPDIFWNRYALHLSRPLNFEAMQQASSLFRGTHDFRGFCASGTSVRDYVRTVFGSSWKNNGGLLEFEISANGFLYNMVRIIVGTLLEVGTGRLEPEMLQEIIASGQRILAGPTVGPKGLCLETVKYSGSGCQGFYLTPLS